MAGLLPGVLALLYVAVRAARQAGDIIARAFDHREGLSVHQKHDRDFVTEVDCKSEASIIREIRKHYPGHGIVAEESGRTNPDAPVQWYIDPLDGTTNFIHGYPHFAVSIGVWNKGKPVLAVIHDPIRNETFEAQNGNGAFLNRSRLRVSSRTDPALALFATGLAPYRRELLGLYMQRMQACMPVAEGYRQGGSAALDLAYVACGRLDAYWEQGLAPWDVAAGIILVQEAGGMATDLQGASADLEKGDVLATNGILHTTFRQLMVVKSET